LSISVAYIRSMSTLTFLWAAGTVTGSKQLLEVDGHRVLIDCGLFQGGKDLRLRNWDPLPVDPAGIDAVILTHAHLDHSGYLPRLVAGGFRGRIFCTPGTKDLCTLVLPDAAHLQEEDAREANRHGYSKHTPALPLYTEADAARALERLQPVGYERYVPVVPGMEVEFVNAGHLLGSAFARVRVADGTIIFGGDLGRYERPVLPDPSPIGEAPDILLLESTYGDRLHEPDDDGVRLATIINDTVRRGGKVIIPSFAIGRVEEVLYWIKRLEDAGRIPVLPVYVDSPMAAGALAFYRSRPGELDPPLPPSEHALCAFCTRRLVTVASAQQSRDLVASRNPGIVIASSGMATGGRVLHHLEATLPNPKNTVLFVGYQAAGTRGRSLRDGAGQVRMKGRDVPVLARIEQIDSMSAHADAAEIMRWLAGCSRPPAMTYLVHGEPAALEALKRRLETERHWPVHVAAYLERVDLRLGASR
jgi:metallo-beta-lactamase family protein